MFKFILSFMAFLAGRDIAFCTGFASQKNYNDVNNINQQHRHQHDDHRTTQRCSKQVIILKVSFGLNDFDVHDVNEYERMMIEARKCAYSDGSSSEDAQHYLFDIFHMENGCVTGIVNGDYCSNNINDVADIVARLRQKITTSSSSSLSASVESSTILNENMMVATTDSTANGRSIRGAIGTSDDSLGLIVPNVLIVVFVGIFVTMMVNSWQPTTADIEAFERHEWSWATQDGYHNTLISHYVRNGGL